MGESVLQRSFSRGELAPAWAARADLELYSQAGRTVRNFIARREGGAYNRPGTVFVAEAKNAGGNVFLFPFYFPAADQSYVIEAGVGYFRFFHNGAPVTVSGVTAWSGATAYEVGDLASRLGVNYYCIQAHTNQQPPNATYWYPLSGNIYEIPTPYTGGEFSPPAPACWSQSGGIVTITHGGHAPRELVYGGDGTSWVLRTITTAPAIAAPANPTGTEGTAGARVYRYVVTAVDAITYEESLASDVITLNCEAPSEDAPNLLEWDAVAGAAEYRIYLDPFENETFGYIGTATGIEDFRDPGAVPDFANTPPLERVLFASANNYPFVSTVYGQRRIFGGTDNDREIGHASQVGLLSNFSIRSPLQDDDAVSWKLASNRIQPIVHLLGLQELVMLTDHGEWVLEGDPNLGGVLTPTAINPRQHGYVGSSFTEPVVIGTSIIHVQARGNVLRDLRFNEEVKRLGGRDLTVLARHLFNRKTIDDLAFQLVPDSIVWAVRSDGTLLGLTYWEDEDTFGWHRHDTVNGEFKQVVVLPEGDEDAVYVLVEREVDDVTVKYIERFEPRDVDAVEDYHFVDSGVIYSGASTTTITGLDHLDLETVVAFADGAPVVDAAGALEEFQVINGSITLPAAVTSAHVGLPITCDLETLSLDVGGSNARNRKKRINELSLIVEAGSFPGFQAGRDSAHLKTVRKEVWDTATTIDGRIEARIEATYNYEGRVFIRHTAPAPLAILAVVPLVELGGDK
jgi:hypothetical protein